MSDKNDQLPPEGALPELPAAADTTARDAADAAEARPEKLEVNQNGAATDAYIAELKREAQKTRLTPEQLAEILADMPSPEEEEREYRELMEQGGLSFEELCSSLGIDVGPQP